MGVALHRVDLVCTKHPIAVDACAAILRPDKLTHQWRQRECGRAIAISPWRVHSGLRSGSCRDRGAAARRRPEGSAITDYVVEDHADSVLGTFSTQKEAIEWAEKNGHKPLVARVRHLNDKKNPDHWREA
jgi:hypothetical protein